MNDIEIIENVPVAPSNGFKILSKELKFEHGSESRAAVGKYHTRLDRCSGRRGENSGECRKETRG